MESMVMELARRVVGAPGRIAVAVVVSVSVAVGLFAPLGPVAYARPAKSGVGTVEETKAEPTALAISLQGEGQSAANITVPDRTPVSASVTLTGSNASRARGTVSYAVYSDSACTNEVAWAGPRLIRRSTESPPVRLRPGTYYWQSSYNGDALDQSSTSTCGAAVETVEGSDPPACTKAAGQMHVETEEGHLIVREALTTDLGAPQRLVAAWSQGHHLRLRRLLGASCIARTTRSHFRGVGEAMVDGKPGYKVRFSIRVSSNGEEALRIHIRNERHEPITALTAFPAAGSEIIG
jgi:hypothetical protein